MRIDIADGGLFMATLEGPDNKLYSVTADTPQHLRRQIDKFVTHWEFDWKLSHTCSERFLAAWKAAVLIAGEENFETPSTGVLTATSLDQVRPKSSVNGLAEGLILSERRFLAFLLWLYSPGQAIRYQHENRCADPAPIQADPARRWLMAELMKWHPGRYDW